MIFHTGKFHAASRFTPCPKVSATFSRLDEENPDLPVEELISLTSSQLSISRDAVIRKLWGKK